LDFLIKEIFTPEVMLLRLAATTGEVSFNDVDSEGLPQVGIKKWYLPDYVPLR
jgi:hypothetical protein